MDNVQVVQGLGRRAAPIEHGTERCYRNGCRLDTCRAASAVARKARYLPAACHSCGQTLPDRVRGRRYCPECKAARFTGTARTAATPASRAVLAQEAIDAVPVLWRGHRLSQTISRGRRS